jgi:pyruvate dehydrogenase E1 component alpha subunit
MMIRQILAKESTAMRSLSSQLSQSQSLFALRGQGQSAPARLFSSTQSAHSESIEIDLTGKFEVHNCDELPTSVEITKDELMTMHRDMYEMRRMEITCDSEYKARNIRGFCHLYDGQEAIGSGMKQSLTFDDPLITSYRCHCHALARGDTVEQILAELFGKHEGSMMGKGGSMHFYNKENNFYGGAAIVGAQVPIAAGLAFSVKYNHKGDASADNLMHTAFGMYGDGAANQGQIWEAANMARLWKLPVCLLIENNQYGMGTSTERSSANVNYYKTGGDIIPGVKCDGMDSVAVKVAIQYIKEYCGAGNGPIYAEMNTYRYHGHSMSDPGVTYRSRDEITKTRAARDPIETVKRYITEAGFADAAELKAIEKTIRTEVSEAAARAKNGTLPPNEELFSHMYAEDLETCKSEIPEYIRMPEEPLSVIDGKLPATYQ